jgi:hypothetical protein
MLAMLLLAILQTAELRSAQSMDWYAWLLEEGGFGRLDRERAAFLIREADGSLTVEPWPDGGFRHARFRGTVPARTIALLHTHPREERQPSARDRDVARDLGIPVIVVTPESVIAARPEGRTEVLSASSWR